MTAKKDVQKIEAKLVRVLSALPIDGKEYAANDVVEFPPEVVEARVKSGEVDESEAAVDYCLQELGKKPIKHEPVAAEVSGESESEGDA